LLAQAIKRIDTAKAEADTAARAGEIEDHDAYIWRRYLGFAQSDVRAARSAPTATAFEQGLARARFWERFMLREIPHAGPPPPALDLGCRESAQTRPDSTLISIGDCSGGAISEIVVVFPQREGAGALTVSRGGPRSVRPSANGSRVIRFDFVKPLRLGRGAEATFVTRPQVRGQSRLIVELTDMITEKIDRKTVKVRR
jgi:hypothetical protein